MPPKKKESQARTTSPHDVAFEGTLVDDAAFTRALAAFGRLDPVFADALTAHDAWPPLRRRAPGFAGLAAIVVSQQVSTASAAAIFGRVEAAFPTLDAAAIAGADDATLRACGLSGPKQRALRAVAAAMAEGRLDFAALATGEAEAAHATLCTIKGIGPWSADVFLLFCLGHPDAFPAGDLGLQEGAKLILGLEARPDARVLLALAERWRPLRGVAAHCLWSYCGAMRRRAVAPVLPRAPPDPPAETARKSRSRTKGTA